MTKYVVSISRQFGCGAHEIAGKLSADLKIPYYDKEIIKRAATESEFSEEIFRFYDERVTKSLLYSASTQGVLPISNVNSLENQVFLYQINAIKQYAREGSCIIVGRAADYILKGEVNLITVFLYADIEERVKRVTEIYGISPKEAKTKIKDTDRMRARYHNFYSEDRWGETATYDLSVNVARLGIDNTVLLIKKYVDLKSE